MTDQMIEPFVACLQRGPSITWCNRTFSPSREYVFADAGYALAHYRKPLDGPLPFDARRGRPPIMQACVTCAAMYDAEVERTQKSL
jgi:hypothetical protein